MAHVNLPSDTVHELIDKVNPSELDTLPINPRSNQVDRVHDKRRQDDLEREIEEQEERDNW